MLLLNTSKREREKELFYTWHKTKQNKKRRRKNNENFKSTVRVSEREKANDRAVVSIIQRLDSNSLYRFCYKNILN
jgi:hypothetical protein